MDNCHPDQPAFERAFSFIPTPGLAPGFCFYGRDTRNQTLIPFAAGLKKLCMSKSKYYDLRSPRSSRHDPELPGTISLDSGEKSPVAFIEQEIECYIRTLIERARAPSEK